MVSDKLFISISITLEAGTIQEEAERIRENLLDLTRRILKVENQPQAIVGSMLSDFDQSSRS